MAPVTEGAQYRGPDVCVVLDDQYVRHSASVAISRRWPAERHRAGQSLARPLGTR